MAFCGKCGEQLQTGARFCPKCGEAAVAEGAYQQQPPQGGQQYQQQAQGGPQYQQQAQGGQQYQQYQQQGQGGQQYQQYRPPVQPRVYKDEDTRSMTIGARAMFSYMGLFFLIPLLVDKTSRFARFHAGQGLNLLIFGAGYYIATIILTLLFTAISWRVGPIVGLILSIGALWIPAFTILGIVRVCTGQMKLLPIFGKLEIIKM